MNNFYYRIALFLIGCLSTRIMLAYLVKTYGNYYTKELAVILIVIATGFAYIYITNSRKTGGEVFGEKIWWNRMRPIHSGLYFISAFMLLSKNKQAYVPLILDVGIGFTAWLLYHFS